ncbi:MAG: TetR/AcrR family transcriptional regulator [Proteobacteria bacterium]|nr:MAG: TetR/AcrR family transcriptional regulator [Pseudomonadota bacterium]
MKKMGKKRESPIDLDKNETKGMVLSVAYRILTIEGRDALTTRTVAEKAGLQPHDLYRYFGDKKGLIEALVEYGFVKYMSEKMQQLEHEDPVESLRAGWDLHVEFGLTHPELYSLMYGEPEFGQKTSAASRAETQLIKKLRVIAVAGRLTVAVETAADLIHSAACGIVLTLLTKPKAERDLSLSRDARDTVIGRITSRTVVENINTKVGAALALQARLDDLSELTQAERGLLGEWLKRMIHERTGTLI